MTQIRTRTELDVLEEWARKERQLLLLRRMRLFQEDGEEAAVIMEAEVQVMDDHPAIPNMQAIQRMLDLQVIPRIRDKVLVLVRQVLVSLVILSPAIHKTEIEDDFRYN